METSRVSGIAIAATLGLAFDQPGGAGSDSYR
jgi:hypothetical protein